MQSTAAWNNAATPHIRRSLGTFPPTAKAARLILASRVARVDASAPRSKLWHGITAAASVASAPRQAALGQCQTFQALGNCKPELCGVASACPFAYYPCRRALMHATATLRDCP